MLSGQILVTFWCNEVNFLRKDFKHTNKFCIEHLHMLKVAKAAVISSTEILTVGLIVVGYYR
jgi:hypothetical protein